MQPVPARAASARFYRPELDVLRFFAFMLVFFAHAQLNPKSFASLNRFGITSGFISGIADVGSLGVFVFFMLSAYLITELLLREKRTTETIHLRSYWLRRILRIWPLYFLFVGFAVLFGLWDPHFHIPSNQLLAMSFLWGNWYFALYGWGHTFVSQLWSISVEEQFYLVWPLILKLGNIRILRSACAALIVMGGISAYLLASQGKSANPYVWTNSFVLFQLFAIGGIAALWARGRAPRMHWTVRGLLLLIGLALFIVSITAFGIHDLGPVDPAKLVLAYASVDIGCMAIFFSFLGAGIASWASFFVYLGKISYGLYVFHLISFDLTAWLLELFHLVHFPLRLPLSLTLTIGFASISYRFIESPFLRLKEKFAVIQSRHV